MKVRFPCDHDKWFSHPIDPRAVRWDWCRGGYTANLTAVENTQGWTHYTGGSPATISLWVEEPVEMDDDDLVEGADDE